MRREDDNEDNKGRPKELGGADLGVGGMLSRLSLVLRALLGRR